MTNFTKPQLKTIRAAMQSALERLDYEGMTFNVTNCIYNGGEATYKVKVLLDGALTKEQKDLRDMATLMDIDTSKIKNTQSGLTLSLVGYNSKARKMPWIVKDMNTGVQYKLTNAQVEEWFKKVEEVVS